MDGPNEHALARNGISSLRAWLAGKPYAVIMMLAMVAAFCAYFSMYAFRRPFTAATYAGQTFAGGVIGLKTALILSQIFGYTLSKYLSVKICSEAGSSRRAPLLLGFIGIAWGSLFLFGFLPGSWKTLAIFINGLPLGMIWGLVVAYLEGRRCSDVLMAALCGSFILASAAVKDVGRWLMSGWGISESWMPAATGALFLPMFLVSVLVLACLPPPTADDIAARQPRVPMDRAARGAFLRRFAPGIILLIVFYFFLTAFRDFRDNFGVEIFKNLGYGTEHAALFTRTEIPVAVVSLCALALLNMVRNHRRALMLTYGSMMFGMLLLAASTWAIQQQMISGLAWMVCTGLGAYLAYAPINAVLFERLMAATGSAGTAVFGIQLADSAGYTGSALMQVYKDLGGATTSHLAYFHTFALALGMGGFLLCAGGAWYFGRVTKSTHVAKSDIVR